MQTETLSLELTTGKFPRGASAKRPDDWLMIIDPLAHTKLEAWLSATPLELSGYALLSEPVKA